MAGRSQSSRATSASCSLGQQPPWRSCFWKLEPASSPTPAAQPATLPIRITWNSAVGATRSLHQQCAGKSKRDVFCSGLCTRREEELWVHPRSREPGAWLCFLGTEAGMQELLLPSHIFNGHRVLLRELCSSPAPSHLLFAHCSWFLIPASAQHQVLSPGWLTGIICCPGTFFPLSLCVDKSLEGGTGCAATALPPLG